MIDDVGSEDAVELRTLFPVEVAIDPRIFRAFGSFFSEISSAALEISTHAVCSNCVAIETWL